MNILGLISSPDPPGRFRILQYKEYLTNKGYNLNCRYFTPLKDSDPASWTYTIKKITGINEWRIWNFVKTINFSALAWEQKKYDIIWQNRLLHIKHFFWETKLKKPVVFDFDDAIWLNEGEKQVQKKIRNSALIFAGNDYLADYANKFNNKVCIVPTTVDTKKFIPDDFISELFTIGWIGTPSNFLYLDIIRPAIMIFLAENNDARLVIISSQKPSNFIFDNKQIIFQPWHPDKENEQLNKFSVGIMPLEDTEWTRGKCSCKMLQYMACGKPVVASAVGMNKKILEADIGFAANTTKEWINAFKILKKDREAAKILGQNGRKIIEQEYSCEKWSEYISKQFQLLA